MADVKISGLPASTTPLAGTEVLPIVQSSTTKKVSIANVTAGRAVSALSFAPTGSALPTNGLFLPDTNAVGISTNSEECARFFATGGVSIGNTVDPGATNLSVTGKGYIGTSTPQSPWITGVSPYLSVEKTANYTGISAYSYSAGVSAGGVLSLGHSKSATLGTLAATASGDLLGAISFEGVNSSSALFAGSYISSTQSGAAGAAYFSASLNFFTSNGTNNAAQNMTLFGSGGVSIGNTTDLGAGALNVTGNIQTTGNYRFTGGTNTYLFATQSANSTVTMSMWDGAVNQTPMTWKPTGVAINGTTITSGYILDVTGSVRITGVSTTGGYTVATLPTGAVGMRAYVTNALAPTYGSAVVGGGAVTIPVFYNGTTWIVA